MHQQEQLRALKTSREMLTLAGGRSHCSTKGPYRRSFEGHAEATERVKKQSCSGLGYG